MYSSLKCGRLLLCFCCFNPSLYIFLLKPFPRLYERFNFIFKKDMIARTLWCLLDLPHRRLFLINLIDYIYFFFSSLHHPPAVSISYFFFYFMYMYDVYQVLGKQKGNFLFIYILKNSTNWRFLCTYNLSVPFMSFKHEAHLHHV